MADSAEGAAGLDQLSLGELFDCGRYGTSVVAENEHGKLVSIHDVPSGLACTCKCPGCDRRMVARKGKELAHHFAHHGIVGVTCASAGESALHKFAKEVLDQRLQIGLPALTVTEAGEAEVIVRERPFKFDAATLEQRTGKIVPDVILVKGDRQLMIEFMVTHACGPEKIEFIRTLDIGAIEIDLSAYRNVKLGELVEKILFQADRKWLHNPKSSAARDRARKRSQEKAEALAARVRELAGKYQHRPPAKLGGRGAYESALRRDGLGGHINLDVKGAGCFKVPLAEWQAAALQELLKAGRHGVLEFDVYSALEKRGWIDTWFQEAGRDTIDGARRLVPAFELPARSIQLYFKLLQADGLLISSDAGTWWAADTLTRIVASARELRQRPAKRFEEIKAVITHKLNALPAGEVASFDLDTWSRQPLPGRGYSLRQALHFDVPAWRSLHSELANLSDQIAIFPKPDLDLLGLPLDAELARSVAAKAEALAAREEAHQLELQAAANRRIANLRSWARQNLGTVADEWLAAPNARLDGRIPSEVAAVSDDEYVRAERALEKRIREQELERAQARAKEEAQKKVKDIAKALLGDERTKLWMRNYHPVLRARPEQFAIDSKTADRCIEILQPKKRR
ncbi:hypothetical protein OIU35_17880 [Boseaceae bacterium BT-24-1]|nr:hypothetical protein [Boseaceae bacterium BT-24-1]